jgi:benzoylformate decarboxylase
MTDDYTGADLFVDALSRYGVQHLFGNPGTTELPLMHALEGSDIEYVLGLHEDVAVGAAAGYASTRRYHAHATDAHDSGAPDSDAQGPVVNPVGVVNLHVTPGLAHGLGNLYGAMVAGAPLVVTAGNHSRDFRHEEPILSGDLVSMAEPFTKWSDEVLDVRALPTMLRRAFRVALTPPTGPVFLALPLDVMRSSTDRGPERLGPVPKPGRAAPEQVVHAADCIAEGEDLALVVGDQVARSDAVGAAVDLAEASGARVHGEILSAEVNFPADHDQWVSFVPSSEEPARETLDAHTLVLVGCSTNTTLTRRERPLVDPGTTCVHVGVDPWQLGKNEPVDAVAYGDIAPTLSELADIVAERLPERRRERRLARARERRAAARPDPPTVDPDAPATKGQLVEALYEAAPDAYVVDEGVTSKYALLRRWPLAPRGFLSNKGGGLGYGLPASVGAALAESTREDGDPREVVGFVGDGSYLYYPHALYTAARHDLDLTVVVSDNRNYRILKDNMLALEGGEEADYAFVGTDFDPPVDIAGSARAHGASAELVERAGDLPEALSAALSTDGPSVVDVLVTDD